MSWKTRALAGGVLFVAIYNLIPHSITQSLSHFFRFALVNMLCRMPFDEVGSTESIDTGALLSGLFT